MNVVTRGVRNAFRNTIRTVSIVLILGLSVGLAVSMLVARQAVQEKIDTVKSSVGNTINITPAGFRGFEGGGEPLTIESLAQVSSIGGVTSITYVLNDRLTTESSTLVSAIEPGTLGNRGAGNAGIRFQGPMPQNETQGMTSNPTRTFTPPIMVTGTNDLSRASSYGGDTVSYSSGQAFNPTSDENVAVIGIALAEKNSLSVGSTFTAYNTAITVVGIYDTGNTFANAGLLLPLSTLQRLSEQSGQISIATAYVDTVDNLASVATQVKEVLGSTADVTSNQETAASLVSPLENVKSISLFSLLGALVAGAIIILLTMMMIVRERRREIGVMKALGASNKKTMLQFIIEAVTLTAIGLIVGLGIGVVGASPITKVLVNNSTSSQPSELTTGRDMPQRGLRRLGSSSVSNIKNIQTSVGLDMVAYGLLAALFIAVIGSAIPAYAISKIRPAEVMRAD